MQMKLGCVLMAAGAARRFGENKLLAEFAGAPLYERALSAIPAEEFAGVAVVSHYEAILRAARLRGFAAVYNPAPEDGVSRTIALGMDALPGMDALLFLVADQPLLRRESVAAQTRVLSRTSAEYRSPGAWRAARQPRRFSSGILPRAARAHRRRGRECRHPRRIGCASAV